jgi:hypothetical protein
MINKLYVWTIVGAVLFGSISLNFWQAAELGERKEALHTCARNLEQASEALETAADQLKEYQDGNVLRRDEAAAICRRSTLAAYDAGVGSVSGRTVAERAAQGAFVPGQRVAGGSR